MEKYLTIKFKSQTKYALGKAGAFLVFGKAPMQMIARRAGYVCNFGFYEKLFDIFIR